MKTDSYLCITSYHNEFLKSDAGKPDNYIIFNNALCGLAISGPEIQMGNGHGRTNMTAIYRQIEATATRDTHNGAHDFRGGGGLFAKYMVTCIPILNVGTARVMTACRQAQARKTPDVQILNHPRISCAVQSSSHLSDSHAT